MTAATTSTKHPSETWGDYARRVGPDTAQAFAESVGIDLAAVAAEHDAALERSRPGAIVDAPDPTDPRRLIPLYRLQSDSVMNLIPALIKARRVFMPVLKDANNSHLGTRYATLASVLDATLEGLCENGLLLMQQTDIDGDGKPVVLTRLMHESGEWTAVHYPIYTQPDRNGYVGPQVLGAAVTYSRRYSALLALGVAPEDDDGMAAATQTRPGGVYPRPNRQQPADDNPDGNQPSGDAPESNGALVSKAASDHYATLIEHLDEMPKHAELGRRMAGDARVLPAHKAALKSLWDVKGTEIQNAAKAVRPAALKRLADRSALPVDSVARRKAEAGAREAHPDGLKGAALAIGLVVSSDDDYKVVTTAEFNAMAAVTKDQAGEAELKHAEPDA